MAGITSIELEAVLKAQLSTLQNDLSTSFVGPMKSLQAELEEVRMENQQLRRQLEVATQNTFGRKGRYQCLEEDAECPFAEQRAFKEEAVHGVAFDEEAIRKSGSDLPGSLGEEEPMVPAPLPTYAPSPDEFAPILPVDGQRSNSSTHVVEPLSLDDDCNSTGHNDGEQDHSMQMALAQFTKVSTGNFPSESPQSHGMNHAPRPSVGPGGGAWHIRNVTPETKETLQLLSTVNLFARLPKADRPTLVEACERVEFSEGHTLFEQGDVGDAFYLLIEGCLSVSIDEKKVTSLEAGDYFGELTLLRHERRSATVTAESAITVLRIKRSTFQLADLHHKLATSKPGSAPVFADAAAMKAKLREAMRKPTYDVRNFYKKKGIMQKIARSSLFDNITLSIIAFNAIWISVDTDRNKEDLLMDAHPTFIVAENFFCLYFSGEWLIRFCSFRLKRNCCRDAWFMFDSLLVFIMVLETWVMNAIVLLVGGAGAEGFGDASILRLFRLLRLSRMARMARLLKAMPELMVLIKGLTVAMRSVFFTLLLLFGVIYIFAISFVQLTKGSEVGDLYFKTVPEAMNSLLLHGMLPDQADIIEGVAAEGVIFRIGILLYILFASLTVMNMLVGVLCEVVTVVSAVEKESLLVNHVKATLSEMLESEGIDVENHLIAKHEFDLMLENPSAAKALSEVGVDVVGLVDFTDFIFKEGRELSFPDFMDMVLQLRGSNTATVKDVVDLRKLLSAEFEKLVSKFSDKFDEKIDLSANSRSPNDDFNSYLGLNTQANSRSGTPGAQADPGGLSLPPEIALQQLNWAASAAVRLTSAATELSAAATELSHRRQQKQLANLASGRSEK